MSTKEQRERIELLQGILDLLILRTLRLGPTHPHAIAKAIEMRSEDVLQVEQVLLLRRIATCLAVYGTFDSQHEPWTFWMTNVMELVNTSR
jgi:hypothetical protein